MKLHNIVMKEKVEIRSKISSVDLRKNYDGGCLLQIVLDNKNFDRLCFNNESLLEFDKLGEVWKINKEQVFELTCAKLDNGKFNLYSFYTYDQYQSNFERQLREVINRQD